MSTPSGDQPTRVLPSTAEQPPATTAAPQPATFWRQRVPAHLGRARTSTVVLAVLFVAFFALYVLVRPAVEYTTVRTESGQTVRVPVSELAPTTGPAEPTEPAAPTTEAPDNTDPGEPTGGTEPEETTSQRTPPASTSPDEEEPTGSTTSPEPTTTRAPATTEESAPTPDTEETPTPTG